MTSRTLLLVAGPSGSGKSRLCRVGGADGSIACLSLDEFYHDVDHPGMPMTTLGIPDWDHPGSWDGELAVATLGRLLADGVAEIPTYDISLSRRVGTRTLDVRGATVLLAEGIFAPEALAACRAAGLGVEAIWLDRRRPANFSRRLARDLREKRKRPSVLLRRGLALYRAEPALRRRALAAGFRPLTMRRALARVRSLADQELGARPQSDPAR